MILKRRLLNGEILLPDDIQPGEEYEQNDGDQGLFGSLDFKRARQMGENKGDAAGCPDKQENIAEIKKRGSVMDEHAECFGQRGGNKPKRHIVNQRRIGLIVKYRPLIINQIAEDGIAEMVIKRLVPEIADAGKETPDDGNSRHYHQAASAANSFFVFFGFRKSFIKSDGKKKREQNGKRGVQPADNKDKQRQGKVDIGQLRELCDFHIRSFSAKEGQTPLRFKLFCFPLTWRA